MSSQKFERKAKHVPNTEHGLHKKLKNCENALSNAADGTYNASLRMAIQANKDPVIAVNQQMEANKLNAALRANVAIESYEKNGLKEPRTRNHNKKNKGKSSSHCPDTPRTRELR